MCANSKEKFNLSKMINDAFKNAYEKDDEKTDAYKNADKKNNTSRIKQVRNANRSKNFVESLAEKFNEQYNEEKYWVFSRGKDSKKEFLLNELLYDIHVCEINSFKPAKSHKEYNFITKALWQVESEFNKSSREVVKDFQKLVVGNAQNKLIIARATDDWEKYILENGMHEIAECCCKNMDNANIYLALVPHPEKWGENRKNKVKCKELLKDISCFEFKKDKWISINI